jgi:hypothetical protein
VNRVTTSDCFPRRHRSLRPGIDVPEEDLAQLLGARLRFRHRADERDRCHRIAGPVVHGRCDREAAAVSIRGNPCALDRVVFLEERVDEIVFLGAVTTQVRVAFGVRPLGEPRFAARGDEEDAATVRRDRFRLRRCR